FNSQKHFTANHHPGEFGGIGLAGLHSADNLTVTHDRHFIRDRQDLCKFVCDYYYSLSLLPHPPENCKELFNFLRCQDGGWFIEDQQTSVTIKRLQEFNALLLTNR